MVDEINQQFVADQEKIARAKDDATTLRTYSRFFLEPVKGVMLRAADTLDPPPPPLIPITREYPCFYMVWTKTGTWPRATHANEAKAVAEAERLARKHPGKKFIVLHAWLKLSVAEQQEKA